MTIKDLPFENKYVWTFLRWNSYLSEKYKLLYIATPKVACTSLKWWFASLEGYDEILSKVTDSGESDPDLVIHDSFHKIAPGVAGLMPDALAEPLVSDAYFRFAVVRNPYKRIFSAWQSKLMLREPIQIVPYTKYDFLWMPIKNKSDIALAFEGFLEHLASNEAPNYLDLHWTPQVNLLRPDLINYTNLSQIENVKELKLELARHLGPDIPDPFLSRHANESLIPYLPDFITERAGELIRSLYAGDFQTFGYDNQPPEAKAKFSVAELDVALQAVRLIRGRHQRLSEIRVPLSEKIASLNQVVGERDGQVASLNQVVVERDGQIASLNQAVAERDGRISSLLAQVIKKEQTMLELSSQVVEKERSLQAIMLQNRNYERELTQIKNSKVWKIVLLRRQISRFIASPLKRANQNLEADVALVRSSDLFDELWYLANNPDVAAADIDPALHYVRFGGFESRDPGPQFCSARYLAAYKDVKKAGVNPLVHFLKYGRHENRLAQPPLENRLAQPSLAKEQEYVDSVLEKDEPVRYMPLLDGSLLVGGERKRNNKDSNKQGLKIVLAVHQFVPDYSSGTEVLTYETAKALQKQGHEVIVFTGYPAQGELKDAKRFDRYEYDGIRVERFHHSYTPMGDQTNVLEMEYDNRLFGSYFREFLEYEKPDLVHFFHLSRLSASPIDACNELNIPTVLTPTDFWFICHTSHLRLPNDQACLGPDKSGVNCLRHVLVVHRFTRINAIMQKLPDWLIAPLIFLIKHGVNFDKKYSPYVRALVNRREFLGQRLNRVDKIVVPTKVMMDSLTYNGLEIQRAISLPYGLNLSYLKNAKRPEPGSVLRLGYIGTLYEHKGVHVLVEAIKKLNGRPVELHIYGKLNDFPNYVESLRRIAQGDLRIKFCGTFPNTEIGSIFSGLDALVVPSLWHENAPLVVYSAQAAACPVIASDMEGISEVIEHMKNGLLFKSGSIPDLMSTIELLLDDRELLQKLSNNAKRPLSMQEYGMRLSAIYDELMLVRRSL